jgi:hypothetical protein
MFPLFTNFWAGLSTWWRMSEELVSPQMFPLFTTFWAGLFTW